MGKDEQQVESYLRDLDSVPKLSEEEIRHFIASRAIALQRVVTSHLHLVVSLTKEFSGQDRSQIDLILKGNIGLIHAVETFDLASQESFSDYARRCIRTAIAQAQKE